LFNFPDKPRTIYVLSRSEFVAAVARLAVTMCFYFSRKCFDLKAKPLKWLCGVPLAIYNWGLLLGIGHASPCNGKSPTENFELLSSLILEQFI